MARYDVFLSYASEDREAVALPLCNALQAFGLAVWFDQAALSVGDSLSEKIDDGLAQAAFGVVVISEAFLSKGWTRRELRGLVARETGDQTDFMLPVWHEITRDRVCSVSPPLADKVGLNSSLGIQEVATLIFRRVCRLPHPWSADTAEFADMVETMVALQELARIRHSYHIELPPERLNALRNRLLARLDSFGSAPWGLEVVQMVRDANDAPEAVLPLGLLLAFSQLPGGVNNSASPTRIGSFFRSRRDGLSLHLTDEARRSVEPVVEIMLFEAFRPKNPTMTDRMDAVVHYWRMLADIALFQAQSPACLTPHPLARFIDSLERRIQVCCDSLRDQPELTNALQAAVSAMVPVLLSGDIDGANVMAETFVDIAAELDRLLPRAPSSLDDLDGSERTFIQACTVQIATWKADVNAEWQRELKARLTEIGG